MVRIRSGGFREAAITVLGDSKEPLTAKEIVEIAQTRGILRTGGVTPGNTMHAILAKDVAGDEIGDFVRAGDGRFHLSTRGREVAQSLRRTGGN